MTSIGADAFRDCSSLATATYASGATIGDCAFANCPNLGSGDGDDDDDGENGSGDGDGNGGDDGDDGDGDDGDDDDGDNGGGGNGSSVSLPLALYSSDATPVTGLASIYNGYVVYGDAIAGTILVKLGKSNARTNKARIAATVQLLGIGKIAFSATEEVSSEAPMTVTLSKSGYSLSLVLSASNLGGSLAGMTIAGSRNFTAAKESRSAEYASFKGVWTAPLATPADGTLTFTLDTSAFPSAITSRAVVAESLPASVTLTVKSGKFIVTDSTAALKLTYRAATGLFTGSFTAYVQNGTRTAKVKVPVYGAFVDGAGYGAATVKKTASTPVTIQ